MPCIKDAVPFLKSPLVLSKIKSSLCLIWSVVETNSLNLSLFWQNNFFVLCKRDWEETADYDLPLRPLMFNFRQHPLY